MKLSITEFLNIYPWEEKYTKDMPKKIDWFWYFDLETPIDSLWSYISDTSRLNQAIGLSEMTFKEIDGILYGNAINSGIKLEWIEIPWTWIYGNHLISIREYSKGFAHTVKAIYHFEKLNENSTRLYVYLGWIPRGIFYKLLLLFSEKVILNKYKKALSDIVENYKTKNFKAYTLEEEKENKIENVLALFKISEGLKSKNISEEIISKLIQYIQFGNEQDLYRIRALELANKWNFNPREFVVACMHATRLGLLTISWDVICPHCRGTRLETSSLYEISEKGNCDVCEIDFKNDSENSIEITFHIHPSIRKVEKVFYCSAEPAKKPHIRFQKYLNSNEAIEAKIDLPIGLYRLRVKGHENYGNLNITDSIDINKVNWTQLENGNYQASPNPTILLQNTYNKPQLFTIEETTWDPFALKPGYLFTLHEFHDLFSAESLSSDLKLELGLQTVLFTDIVGSSSLYELEGDSKAFITVKKHFEEINKFVKENNGAIIKTIGDAVMAAFPSPIGAIRASIQLRNQFNGIAMNGIRLRISIHYGQCIAVNLNSGIDYFGKTVNIAAKIQKLAGASQIVFTKEYRDNPEVSLFIEINNIQTERIDFTIPGMRDNFLIFRINES